MGIRLADGIKPNQGRVEVSRDGVWGTVCHGRWSTSDAVVVCRQLFYASGVSYRGSYHGPGTGPILMDKVSCSGYEHSIYQCPNLGWNVSSDSCKNHSQDAGVYCMPWGRYEAPPSSKFSNPLTHSSTQILKGKCINLRLNLRFEAEYWLEENWCW